MRARVLLICLSLLLAGTVLAPGVAAREIGGSSDDCVKPTTTGVHKTCGKVYVVNNTVACIWNGYWYEAGAGAVVYREYRCSGNPPS